MAQQFIGRYEVIAELGRGGMATVFHAYDPDFDRPVAIKVMPREFLHRPDFKTRFQREARIIAALEHDAIVPVHDIGEHDDLPYLVMRYMSGGSLSDRIQREPLSAYEAALLFERLAPAIDFAHTQGFVHRDLKPDNILFDQHDNAFIADFGIAKLMHSTSQLTGSGALVGTPAYMSPEQIQDKGEVDHRSDLYSLGVILYETLTGEMPFVVDSSVGYFSAHLNDPVPDIRDVRPDLPPAFSSIIYRAMAKDKDDRYQSAADLASDIARALDPDAFDDEYETPLFESPPARRIPYALIGGAALVLVVLGLLVSGVFRSPEGTVGMAATTGAGQAADMPTPTAVDSTDSESDTSSEIVDLRTAGWIVYSYASIDPESGASPDYDIYVMRADGEQRTRLTVTDASDENPAWSPDGTRIAFNSDRDGDKEIYVMDADGLNLTRLTFSEGSDFGPRWSPDGSQIVFASDRDGNREIYVMDADGGNQTRLTDNDARDYWPDWSPDGSQIVFSSSRIDGVEGIFVMDADGTGLYQFFAADKVARLYPRWSPDGTQIAITSYFTPEMTQTPTGLGCWVGLDTLLVNLDGSNRAEPTPAASDKCMSWAAWSPDGTHLIGLVDQINTGLDERYDIEIHRRPQASQNDDSLIAALTNVNLETQFLWPDWWAPPTSDSEPSAETIDLRTAGWIVYSYASDLDPDEQNPEYDIYTMRADGQERTRLTVSDASDENPAWSPDGTRIAFNSDRDGDKEIYVMDADGLNLTRLTFSEGSDFGPRWSPDGSQIVFASERDGNREIYVMDADGGNQTRLTDNDARDYWPDWSPDGSQIVFSSSRSGGVEGIFIMDADGTGLYQFLAANNLSRLFPRWSPDGTQIAIFSQMPVAPAGSRCGFEETIILVLDGSNRTDPSLVTSGECMHWGAWSPDGSYLIGMVDSRISLAGPFYNIEVHEHPDSDVDGKSLVARLATVSLEERYFWPDWWAPPTAEVESAPEPAEDIDLRTAGWIVYSYADDQTDCCYLTNYEIYVMRADGEERTRLTVNDAHDENPAWSPDGTRIAFNSDRDGNREIYVMDEDGLNQTRLTFSEGADFGPRWSPDGTQIAFASERDGNLEIYSMNADGSNQTRLTNSEARDYWPDWSPDGTQIVFSSSRIGGIERLFIMNADGSQLSPPLGRPDIYADLYPRWSPDGQSIVFQQEYGMFDFDRSCVPVAVGDTLLLNLADSGAEPTLVATCFAWAAWSPDGGLLVGNVWYGGDARRYNFGVFSLPGESGDPNQLFAQLTDVAFEDQFDWPDWKP